MNTDLVMLSICETRLGNLMSAEDEIVGLNRASVYGGTPSVVASLWSVEDEATMELMVAFYDYLENGGYSKGEALRQAQLDLLGSPATAHPYYWAGFVLTGDVGEPGSDQSVVLETPSASSKDNSGGDMNCFSIALPLALVGMVVVRRFERR